MEYMYPMDFEEFLMATSSHGLIDEIYKCYNSSIPMTSTLHEKLMGLYRMYLCVGGMPQAVQNIVDVNQNIFDFDKDIIKRRLDAGITYTEFSYMIMQAMDFEHLYNERGVTMQVAGQDQWGNITAGIELIRKKDGKEAFAFTMPLITKSDGTKFGKTEGKAIWLDKNKTTPYEMYQFFVNVEDSMVIDYLKKFTFLSKEEIEKIEKEHNLHPEERLAHKTLAKEVITFIHGEKAYEDALKQANALFNGDISSLGAENLLNEFKDVPHFIVIENENILDMLIRGKICSSKREAREMVSAGAISINGNKETNLDKIITENDLIEEKVILLKKGKKNYFLGTK